MTTLRGEDCSVLLNCRLKYFYQSSLLYQGFKSSISLNPWLYVFQFCSMEEIMFSMPLLVSLWVTLDLSRKHLPWAEPEKRVMRQGCSLPKWYVWQVPSCGRYFLMFLFYLEKVHRMIKAAISRIYPQNRATMRVVCLKIHMAILSHQTQKFCWISNFY